MNAAELTGRARTHVATVPQLASDLHVQVIAPFLSLRKQALLDGFDLVAHSGFRDFERQLAIWNGKYQGTRPSCIGRPCRAPAGTIGAPMWI